MAAVSLDAYVQSLRGHPLQPLTFGALCKSATGEFPSSVVEVDLSRRYADCGVD